MENKKYQKPKKKLMKVIDHVCKNNVFMSKNTSVKTSKLTNIFRIHKIFMKMLCYITRT